MQMKQIFPLLAVALLLTGCQVRSVSNENDDDIIEAWLCPDSLTKTPVLPARIDNTLKNICPDYLPGADSVPSITGEVKMLPLAPTPGFRIGWIEKIETDGDLIFILGAETENDEPFSYHPKERAGFIFRMDGSLVARLKLSDVSKEQDMITLAVNRQTHEVSLMCWGNHCEDADLLTYDYKGKLLRHEEAFFNYGTVMGFTQNHLISNLRPPFDFAPQLSVRDPEGYPHGFILSRPNKVYSYDYEVSLTNSGDDLFYATVNSDTIWQVEPEGAIARYLVSGDSVGIGTLPFNNDSTITKSQRLLARENRYVPRIDYDIPLLVSPDFLLCHYVNEYNIKIEKETENMFNWSAEAKHAILVYDRTTGHSCWTWNFGPIRTLQGLCLTGAQALTTDGTLISYGTPVNLKYYASHPKDYQLDGKTQNFIKKLDIKANPVLLLMPMKHF
jgi:hypothetical protein